MTDALALWVGPQVITSLEAPTWSSHPQWFPVWSSVCDLRFARLALLSLCTGSILPPPLGTAVRTEDPQDL